MTDRTVRQPVDPADALAPLQARLEGLRREGAWRLAPAHFAYLEALARRLADQPEAVAAPLRERLHAALLAYAARFEQAQAVAAAQASRLAASQPALARELRRLQATGDLTGVRRLATRTARSQATPGLKALAALNAHVREATPARSEPAAPGTPTPREELASARRFRQAWTRRRSLEQVQRAVARAPANAGPLNSHALVLQSLALARELSPAYLRRVLAQVESLQWLERAREKYPMQASKQAKPGRSRRTQ